MKNNGFIGILGLLFILSMIILRGCSSRADDPNVAFARTAFKSLSVGDTRVEGAIDWPSFQCSGMDAGAQYNSLPNETEKAGFRSAFISSFSSSFQASGADADNFTNWRVQGSDTVAADTPSNTTLSVTISQQGEQRKISRLEIG